MDTPSGEIQIRVRYAETDRMGLLHHANYFVYFEIGRTELLRARVVVSRRRGRRASAGDRRLGLQVQAAGVLRRPPDLADIGRAGHARQDRSSLRTLSRRRHALRGSFHSRLRRSRGKAAAASRYAKIVISWFWTLPRPWRSDRRPLGRFWRRERFPRFRDHSARLRFSRSGRRARSVRAGLR